jgi:hypothetical protein
MYLSPAWDNEEKGNTGQAGQVAVRSVRTLLNVGRVQLMYGCRRFIIQLRSKIPALS